MAIKVRIPTPMRSFTSGAAEVHIEAATIRELIDKLEGEYPGMKERICDSDGSLRLYVNIYLNDEDIRSMGDIDTPVKDGDSMHIIPAIAGG